MTEQQNVYDDPDVEVVPPDQPIRTEGTAIVRRMPTGPVRASFSLTDFLEDVDTKIEEQAKLSRAWVSFCDATLTSRDYIDVQRWNPESRKNETMRVKKKSAWRMGARFFQLSTRIVERAASWMYDEREDVNHFTAEYVVRATAPWGVSMEGVGACSTREDRFYTKGAICPDCGGPMWDNRERDGEPEWKSKARADGRLPAFTCRDKSCGGVIDDPTVETVRRPNPTAIANAEHWCHATAETRATNRAISNILAAGEVTAEELDAERAMEADNGGAPHPAEQSTAAKPAKVKNVKDVPVLDRIIAAGKHKGRSIHDVEAEDPGYIEWCAQNPERSPLPVSADELAALHRSVVEADGDEYTGEPATPDDTPRPVNGPGTSPDTGNREPRLPTQGQWDKLVELMDTRAFDPNDAAQMQMKEWATGIISGARTGPSYKGMESALLRIGSLPMKNEVEQLGLADTAPGDDHDQHPGGDVDPDDDLPF